MKHAADTWNIEARIGRRFRLLAYPRLRELPAEQWNAALERARNTSFDAIEWAGMALGVVIVTYALRPAAGDAASLFALYLMQFVLALPLLALFVGPFLLRRTRRGLDTEIAQRHGGDRWKTLQARPHRDGPQPSSSRGSE